MCSGLPANIQLDIDGDRETERIYSLFSTYMSKLIKMQGVYHHPCGLYFRVTGEGAVSNLCSCLTISEACGSKSVYDGPEQEEYSSFVIDDPQETYRILKLVVSAVQQLEQQHAQYKREKFRKTKYGSQ